MTAKKEIRRATVPRTVHQQNGKPRWFNQTDVGNAERFAAEHGKNVRYCHPWGKWLIWDGSRWLMDDTGRITRLAKETARNILHEAAFEKDDGRRKDLARWGFASEKRERLSAMVALARSEPGIPVLPKQLDADSWLLSTSNGVVDLRTGKKRPARREDLCTMQAHATFEGGATCPRWLTFLDTTFGGNQNLIGFVQRLLGSALVGTVHDHVLPIFYGVGSNGKSVLIETVLHVLGDYGDTGSPDLLMAKRGDRHPTEVASLFGKRLVACIESDQQRRLAEGLVKQLTGGDTLTARRMREDFWTFIPSHTLILATNHRPVVTGTDHGIWRRIRLVPFENVITASQDDRHLGEKLKAESTGILAWLVDGCLQWQRDGLGDPDEVASATKDYRSEQDVLGVFLDDACFAGSNDDKVAAGSIYGAYRDWCERTGERAVNQRRFGLAMTERGFDRKNVSGKKWYVGIKLRVDDCRP